MTPAEIKEEISKSRKRVKETMSTPPKSKKTLEAFTAYCKEHPELRFWQALRSFANVSFIYTQNGTEPIHDTFYDE